MLTDIRSYQKAKADKKWVDGMIKAWTGKLVQSCDSKVHANQNKKQIPKDVKQMIAVFLDENSNSYAIRLLQESCVNFGIINKINY